MSQVYNEDYYRSYDVGIEKVDYATSKYTKGFLESVAKHIVSDFHPKTVLDAGCAMGHLVAALRDLGVDAYGIDISDYAIAQVREDIKAFCKVQSLTDPLPAEFPQHFDLVTNIEVMEHLYADDGETAVNRLSSIADIVIFSSTPDDFSEPTHVNVQQREYWARLFAANGMFDDLSYRPTYLTPYAVCYRKSGDLVRQIENYEHDIRIRDSELSDVRDSFRQAIEDKENHIQNQNAIIAQLQSDCESNRQAIEDKENHIRNQNAIIAQLQSDCESNRQAIEDKENHIRNQNAIIAQLEDAQVSLQNACDAKGNIIRGQSAKISELKEKLAELEKELAHYKDHYFAAINQREDLKVQVEKWKSSYETISSAFFWKITKPARALLDLLKRNHAIYLFDKGLHCLKQHGVKYTWNKVKEKYGHNKDKEVALFTQKELKAQKAERFPRNIKFSIVVPLYNTPEKFLREMIDSVLAQTYSNWELCMADGSDEKHAYVSKICAQYTRKDKRIRYQKLEKNLGISGNTNACLDMATGDYIGLFDHDDLLHPAALYEVTKAICNHDADFIYTDENTFQNTPMDAFCPNFKPDYSPDTLRSYNYICHFSVFSKSLLKQAGSFRKEFDGSQDYDMILRLTEKAQHIIHIPMVLYYWRAHENSVAQDISAKPYTLDAARRALGEHLHRLGLSGEVLDSSIPSTYRIKYDIIGNPKISIVIPNMDHVDILNTLLESIFKKTTYSNFEIIIVENNSKLRETFDYYEKLKSNAKIKLVVWDSIFNYSAINNYGIKQAVTGDYVLLLNNDMEVITPDWLQEMLMFAQRPDVGAVGAMLYYPDDTIQHGGVILGIGGVAGHSHKYFQRGSYGYMSRATIAQNFSAVTAACMMIPIEVWHKVDGLDENYKVAFNDVDLCMRIRKAGYLIVWTPYAELYHYESKSRGYEDSPEKQARFLSEINRFKQNWEKELKYGDPYYNPNLTLVREDFSVDSMANAKLRIIDRELANN